VSTGQFPVGTNPVIVIATDMANNSTACTFEIEVIALPTILMQPLSQTNNPGTTARFKVAASSSTPMTFQWKKNGITLSDGGNIFGVSTTDLTVSQVTTFDAGDYSIDVANLAGTTSSTKARLSVMALPGNLKVLGVSAGVVTLQLVGPTGCRFSILTSTNLVQWTPLHTNTAPFIMTHTNAPGPGCRFYRAIALP
jgi:hypothetical protein